MAGVVNFKVYLLHDEKCSYQEIHRFGIDSDVVMNFEYLREKLKMVFSNLRGKQFSINWQDSDGDMIAISNDEELILALDETLKYPIRKLFVKIQDNHHSNTESFPSISPSTLHVGIVCDGCNGLISGFRFKCIQCSNFDLCSSCQSRGLHPEHCMLRLVNPLDAKAQIGSRFMHHMNKFAKKHSQPCNRDDDNNNTAALGKGKGYKCRNKKWEKENKTPIDCPFTSNLGSMINTLAAHIDESAQMPTESPTTTNKTENQTKEQPTSEPKDSPDKCSNSREIPNFQIPLLHQHSDLIKVISQNLSYFLDPLGIDVNILAKTSDHQKPSPSNDKENSNSNSNVHNEAESPTPSTSKSNSETITPKTFNESNDTDKENSVSSSSENKINNQPTICQKNDEYVLEKEDQSDPEWTVINKVTATEKQPSKSAPLYPQLQEEKKIYHRDPKIQKAVELMIQMGFSNDNDQLTNLLVAKNGDIVSVIDLL